MSYDSSALSTPRYRGHLLNWRWRRLFCARCKGERLGTPYLNGSPLLPKQSGGRKPNLAKDAFSDLDLTWISIQTYFDLREGSTSYFNEI